MGTIKADTLTGLADPNKVTLPTNPSIGSTTATLNLGNTVITNASAGSTTITAEGGTNTTNLQLGLVKLSASCSSSASPSEALNVSGGTDHGTGDYSYAPVTNFANNFMKYSGIVRNTSPGQVATRNNGRHDVSVIAYETANASGSNTDLSHEINVFGELA